MEEQSNVDGVNVESMNVSTYDDTDNEYLIVNIEALGYASPKTSSSQIVISQDPSYKIIATDLNTGYSITNYAYIKLATLKASTMNVAAGTNNAFKVTLTDQNRNIVANKNVEITPVEGWTKTVKTDSKGVATLNFNLEAGTYYFITRVFNS